MREIQPGGAAQLQRPRIRRPGAEMLLDEMTQRNLELIDPLRTGEEGGTLIEVLDDLSYFDGRSTAEAVDAPATRSA